MKIKTLFFLLALLMAPALAMAQAPNANSVVHGFSA